METDTTFILGYISVSTIVIIGLLTILFTLKSRFDTLVKKVDVLAKMLISIKHR